MKYLKLNLLYPALVMLVWGCSGPEPEAAALSKLQLKQGPVIACGQPGKEFGVVQFDIEGSTQVKADFNTAVELLHSFEYDDAEKVFAKIINESPNCAMAYWGVAMCNFHPLWEPPGEAELKKGSAAIDIAKGLKNVPSAEAGYINAIGAYYKDWPTTNHHNRCLRFEAAMQQLHELNPGDKEAAIFYALALDAAADPTDKTYSRQKKAGDILSNLYPAAPNHPGIIHYIIHTYDYPGIAQLALPAARRYAQVAPSSAHALHMPSHIFTRLGLWDESIQSNLQSVDAAKCYAQQAGIKGHWDEELHGLDYLVYAYLQKGNDSAAIEAANYLDTIKAVYPVNFKEAYTFAAAPCRIALEGKHWQKAAQLPLQPVWFAWGKFPWQQAIVHFTRLLGDAHTGNLQQANVELIKLDSLQQQLVTLKDAYKAKQVQVQATAGRAWLAHAKHNDTAAIRFAKLAADMEDSTTKHPVTPGEVLPARELYADLLFELHQYDKALTGYNAVLQKSPNRFNSVVGAARAAQLLGKKDDAATYFKQLLSFADVHSKRDVLNTARSFAGVK